jgi:hypothetical protein
MDSLSSFSIRHSTSFDTPAQFSMAVTPTTTRSFVADMPAQLSMAVTLSTIESTAVDVLSQSTTPVAPSLITSTSELVATTFFTTLSSNTDKILILSVSTPNTMTKPSRLSPLDETAYTLIPTSLTHSSLSASETGGIAAAVTFVGVTAIMGLVWLYRCRKRNAMDGDINPNYGKEEIERHKDIQELPGNSRLSELDSSRPVLELESIATNNERWTATHGARRIPPTLPDVSDEGNY